MRRTVVARINCSLLRKLQTIPNPITRFHQTIITLPLVAITLIVSHYYHTKLQSSLATFLLAVELGLEFRDISHPKTCRYRYHPIARKKKKISRNSLKGISARPSFYCHQITSLKIVYTPLTLRLLVHSFVPDISITQKPFGPNSQGCMSDSIHS